MQDAYQKFKEETIFNDEKDGEEEEQELKVREITIQPTSVDVEHISPSFGKMKLSEVQSKSWKEEKGYREKEKETISMFKNKPNVFPKTMQN